MRLLLLFLVLIASVGCNKKMIQLATLSPKNPEVEKLNDEYVFDNDTVRITYRFWSHHGKFEFLIENKLGVPIYIDWKKSNLIFNGTPNVYWVDETVTKSTSVTSGVATGAYGAAYGTAKTSGEAVSRPEERITFLPPSSKIARNEYAIERKSYYAMDLNSEREMVPHEAKKNGKLTAVYTQKFKQYESNFSNFLTFSNTENFKNEWFVKHDFFISQIQEMDLKHFRGYCTGVGGDGKPNCPRKLKSDTKFFLYVPKGYDFEKRKKRGQTEYVAPGTVFGMP
jgi:hypothetical protein